MAGKARRSRRRWSEAFKRRVVAEAAVPGVSAAAIARRYDLNANLLFNWKRRYGASDRFLPVAVSEPSGPPRLPRECAAVERSVVFVLGEPGNPL